MSWHSFSLTTLIKLTFRWKALLFLYSESTTFTTSCSRFVRWIKHKRGSEFGYLLNKLGNCEILFLFWKLSLADNWSQSIQVPIHWEGRVSRDSEVWLRWKSRDLTDLVINSATVYRKYNCRSNIEAMLLTLARILEQAWLLIMIYGVNTSLCYSAPAPLLASQREVSFRTSLISNQSWWCQPRYPHTI